VELKETFKFHMAREKRTTSWGVDFTNDSENSLTVASVVSGHALAVCNAVASAYAAKALAPGDVIVSIDGAKTQVAMIEKLKNETSLIADIIRYSTFDAAIERSLTFDVGDGNSRLEPLGMQVSNCDGKLFIDKIDLKPSPIKRYNDQNYMKPLVKGDVIVAVNGEEAFEDMIHLVKTCAQLTLSVERRQQFGKRQTERFGKSDSARNTAANASHRFGKDERRSDIAQAA
jgi:hypothetical protein